ncbi:MAG: trypsin-like peptidase domain-containing protein [Catenulispora sp.]|nr:trypsin-like peptidase domain-containing protein [Catenulispora sp.]
MAGASQYWVDIHQGGTRLGAGFFITARYVLTARHCLRRIRHDDDTLDLHCADGEVVAARVYRFPVDADLALIETIKPKDGPIALPRPDLPQARDSWADPYRPSQSDPYLKGLVEEAPVSYLCADGTSVQALQLGCEQALGDYSGYSGSPVERADDEDEGSLLGILLEQYLDRENPDRATGVLFAATIGEVLERFDYFGLSHFERILGVRLGAVELPRQAPDPSPLRSKIDKASALMDSLEDWSARGLLDPDEMRVMASRIALSIVDSGIAEMAP